MSRHGQPTRSTCSIPLRKRRLSPAGRAQRPRSGGSNSPINSHSASDKSPRPMTAPQKAVASSFNPFCQHGLKMNDQASIPRMNIPDTEEELFEKIASAMKVLDGLIKKDGAAIQNLRAVR